MFVSPVNLSLNPTPTLTLSTNTVNLSQRDGSAAFLHTKKIMNPDMMVPSKALFKDKGTPTDPPPPPPHPLPLQFSRQEQGANSIFSTKK